MKEKSTITINKILKVVSKFFFAIPILWVIMYLIPLYVWSYRVFLTSLFYPLFIVLIVAYSFQFLKSVIDKNFTSVFLALLGLISAILVICCMGSLYDFRIQVTQGIIQRYYCENGEATQEKILGSIKRIGLFYEDSTACISSVCSEERYYCN